MAFGSTAMHPDNIDLYDETIKDGKYLYNGEWHDIIEHEETIKVRFGSDVKMKIQLTRNGVIVDKDFVSGTAADMVPFITPEVFSVDDAQRTYSLASVFDIRLESVREIDHEDYINKAPFNMYYGLNTLFAEV